MQYVFYGNVASTKFTSPIMEAGFVSGRLSGNSRRSRRSRAAGTSSQLSKIMRIDVDHPSGSKPISIPKDNPFVATPGARGEIWAYGVRNPWRLADLRRFHCPR